MKGIDLLHARDIQVIRLVADGLERDEVAAALGVSRSAVNRQLKHAFEVTGTKNATHLVATLGRAGVTGFAPEAYGESERLADRDRIVKKILTERIAQPEDGVERHVNDVIEQMAALVKRGLS